MFLEKQNFPADKHMTAVWGHNQMWLDFEVIWNLLSISKGNYGLFGRTEISQIILLIKCTCNGHYSYINLNRNTLRIGTSIKLSWIILTPDFEIKPQTNSCHSLLSLNTTGCMCLCNGILILINYSSIHASDEKKLGLLPLHCHTSYNIKMVLVLLLINTLKSKQNGGGPFDFKLHCEYYCSSPQL